MPIVLRSAGERLEMAYEGAVIYYHRLNYSQYLDLWRLHTERGQTKMNELWHTAAHLAVDGWDNKVLSADLQPIPVPHSADLSEQRRQISLVVDALPPELIQDLGQAALEETPDFLQHSLREKFGDVFSFPTVLAAASLPATTAAPSVETTTSLSPATPEGSTPAPIG